MRYGQTTDAVDAKYWDDEDLLEDVKAFMQRYWRGYRNAMKKIWQETESPEAIDRVIRKTAKVLAQDKKLHAKERDILAVLRAKGKNEACAAVARMYGVYGARNDLLLKNKGLWDGFLKDMLEYWKKGVRERILQEWIREYDVCSWRDGYGVSGLDALQELMDWQCENPVSTYAKAFGYAPCRVIYTHPVS